jgi:phytoene dehydrogenase-like protein
MLPNESAALAGEQLLHPSPSDFRHFAANLLPGPRRSVEADAVGAIRTPDEDGFKSVPPPPSVRRGDRIGGRYVGISSLRPVHPVDVVIVGGGHNGLVAAAYLGRAGLRTVVLEQRPLVGGACVTEELWPGFRINRFAYAAGMLRPEVVTELDLGRFGYEPLPFEPQLFLPLAGGRSLALWSDPNRTQKAIAVFSKRDARRFPEYEAYWSRVLDLLEPLWVAPPGPLAEIAGRFAGDEGERLLRDLFLRSASDLLDEWFESAELKTALATGAIAGSPRGPSAAGTAFVLAHNSLGRLGGVRGLWGIARGGMGRISEAIARAAVAAGATIRTDARVRSIRVRDGAVVGVETESGERIESRVVASAVDAQQTLLRLLPPDLLEPDVRRFAEHIRMHATTLKFNAALRAIPRFLSAPEGPRPVLEGLVSLAESVEGLDRAADQARLGRLSDPPYLEVVFQSLRDPTVAPAGRHTMTCSVRVAPRTLAGTSWAAFAAEAERISLDRFATYAPDVRRTIQHSEVVTPETIEQVVGLSGGSCYVGDMTPDQMFGFRPFPGWAGYRLPVPGLYLCGGAAHPGGGVSGIPGRNAARVILSDLARKASG